MGHPQRTAVQHRHQPARHHREFRSAHLALTSAMIPATAGLDRQCPGTEELKVAAVVNWYGITDVVDLLAGPNMNVLPAFAAAGRGEVRGLRRITVSPRQCGAIQTSGALIFGHFRARLRRQRDAIAASEASPSTQ
jgi:hypothetical protein